MDFQTMRRDYLSKPIFDWASGSMPPISETEREAIDAGTVWWDGALFSGNPDWDALLAMAPAKLSDEERAFMEGPVRELCGMIDDWALKAHDRDLPKPVWDFLRRKNFFGMIIPRQYGGLGFSNTAHSEVVRMVSSASVVAGVTVMVPNSLGPGELLMHFGTDQQRDYWLPRLADGREIPCFGLTSADAGSDAAAMKDSGIVERGTWKGRKVLGVRLNFEKRYITLGPIATVMGLAFKMYDPDNLLGRGEELGITVALLPTNTPGVSHGERHIPLSTYFQNGPMHGKDVFIPLDHIIGGEEQIGQGWTMLMTALAAGRSISLPSQASASAAMCARVTGAYARLRSQFGIPIGEFEGVQAALAEITGNAYLVDAARRLTVTALDEGHRPSVISAIMKYHATERMRRSVQHAMDIHGGKGIMEGPRNYIANAYQSVPIGITVEGANILTRNLMIFGQGAIRSHPFMLQELLALSRKDRKEGLEAFDKVFWGHVVHALKTAGRAFLRGWSGGFFAPVPEKGAMKHHWRTLSRYTAAFALTTDFALMSLGGALKRKEHLSARLGDIVAELYLLGAVLKRFEDEGRPGEDRPIVDYLMLEGERRIGAAFKGVFDNLPARWAAWLPRLIAFPFGVPNPASSDRLVGRLAQILMHPSSQRDRLTPHLYLGDRHDTHPIKDLEEAFRFAVAAAPVTRKLRDKRITDPQEAHDKGIISAAELAQLNEADEAIGKVVAVDAFAMEDVSPIAQQHQKPKRSAPRTRTTGAKRPQKQPAQ